MRILLTDESDLTATATGRFFIYGGLIIPVDRLIDLDQGIEAIRARAGYRPGDLLKFDTNSRPPHVCVAPATQAKREVIELCRQVGAKFIAYVVLHDIARNRTRDETVLFGANTVIARFNAYLEENDDFGMVLCDTLPVTSQNQYFCEKFSTGLIVEGETVQLPRVRLFGATCNGASNVASAIDIVLGGFRYCVNSPRNPAAAGELAANTIDLMWGYQRGNDRNVLERGLVLRPKLENIQVPNYHAEYQELVQKLDEHYDRGVDARRGGLIG